MNGFGKIGLLVAAALLGATSLVQAQQVYRIVGPDGRVTFSDRPPENNSGTVSQKGKGGDSESTSSSSGASLPYSLQQIVNRFPVTLYSGADCTPCDSARNLLTSRGIPFTERTIKTNEDINALKNLSGATGVPFGTIGGQRLSGYSDVEWTQYLDAAGYPKQSQLPANYRRPAATPLVAVTEKAPAAAQTPAEAPAARRPQAPALAPSGPTPSNPAGIVF